MVKGLEFEKVVVVQKHMSDNEFYVACTRAISELYVIPHNNHTSKDVESNLTYPLVPSEVPTLPSEPLKCAQNNEETLNLIGLNSVKKYTLFPYKGKLKQYTPTSSTLAIHIPLVINGVTKKILINVLQEKQCAYVQEDTYKSHQLKIAPYFDSIDDSLSSQYVSEPSLLPNIDDINSTSVSPNGEPENQFCTRDLIVSIDENTKTIGLMDKFEGYTGENPYDRMIIKKAMFIRDGFSCLAIDLVVERSNGQPHQGNITFTQFKKGQDQNLQSFVQTQFSTTSIREYQESGKMLRFNKAYLLRAQNRNNRTGYGSEWDWSNRYFPQVTEGTLYGETTNYLFVGAYISK